MTVPRRYGKTCQNNQIMIEYIGPPATVSSRQRHGLAGGFLFWKADMTLTEVEKAYLAGMVDGEGCITILANKKKYFFLQVIVTGVNENHIKRCQEMAGLGNVTSQVKAPPWADLWRWQVSGNEAEVFLKTIKPYLILKTPQADLGLQFARHLRDSGQWGPHKIPPAIIKYRRGLADRLKELKQVGKVIENEPIQIEPEPPRWKMKPLIS